MTGQLLSHYRIREEVGRGGMGIVYLADDERLDRKVALKLLPPHALASEDDRARFYREARAAAALSHPNIAHIYEIDEADMGGGDTRPFIAMEYIDGDTLTQRIAKGPLPFKDAISIATQIAEGLKAAHDKNIVHRDIKSGNIMLTQDGVVKILDFGLAKTAASTKLTQMGSTLGTVSYMSPEQAKGEEVDRRSDIWSLGVILYEMISGRLPFPGDYEQAIVYGILNEDPESLTGLRAGVPLAMDGVIAKMLAKDRALRYQHVDELPADLKAIDLGSTLRTSRISTSRPIEVQDAPVGIESIATEAASRATTHAGALKKAWPAVLLAAVAMFALGWLLRPQQEVITPLRKMIISLPSMQSIGFPRISNHGEWIAFAGTDTSGRGGVFLYEMATGAVHHIEGSERYNYSEFSPDGRRLLLTGWSNIGASAMVIPNGVPNEITSAGNWFVWETDNSVLYTAFEPTSVIYRATLDGSAPERIALADTSLEWATQAYAAGTIPSGAILAGLQAPAGARHAVALLDPDTGDWTVGEEGVANAVYLPGGYAIYQVGNDFGKVVVRPMDGKTGKFTGSPREVLPAITWGGYNVGQDGSLVFVPDELTTNAQTRRIQAVNLESRSLREMNVTTQDDVAEPSYSPSGKEIVVEVTPRRSQSTHIGILDTERGVLSQRTFESDRRDPKWSHDGAWIYYGDGNGNLYRRRADGSGGEEVVFEGAYRVELSRDGRWLLATTAEADGDLFAMELSTKRIVSIDSSAGTQTRASLSPSGRYVAYFSDASGQWRIAVRPIEGSGYWILSDMNASRPRWSPDERHIYYVAATGGIYRIAVNTTNGFRIEGEPERVVSTVGMSDYDFSPDGSVIVVTGQGVTVQEGSRSTASVGLWQNWVQSLPEPADF